MYSIPETAKAKYDPLNEHVLSEDFAHNYGTPITSKIDIHNGIVMVPTDRGLYEVHSQEGTITVVPSSQSRQFTLSSLLSTEFPELIWYVDRLITPGLSLLWGYAKSGKSILALHILVDIVLGRKVLGTLAVKQSSALFISLEDGGRRLKQRLQAAGAIGSDNLIIHTDWSRGTEGVRELELFLDVHPAIRVVVIDTLFLFSKLPDSNDYSSTISLMETLKRVADDRDICIIALHHSKKSGREDSTDITQTALGSTGIVSGPDHLLYLKRTPEGPTDAVLFFRSKDAEPAEIALTFDSTIQGWRYAGEADEMADTDERQEILELLRRNQGSMSTGDIADALRKKKAAVSNLLGRLVKKGAVRKLSYGIYTLPSGESCNPCNCETEGSKEVFHQDQETRTFTVSPLTQEVDAEESEGEDQAQVPLF
ncbi:hypothetical protein B4O97_04015 [Marispirochaeta aestuarii]|uniref:DUF7343 domain-containing protein n=1 Tax=Marispirochaeta aestuarii TaxID=1963862 RepID=A0A1Y1S2S1_9SPIO|nr:AAA family ATPase [Marispirochaeta aestuarii]ORC37366.1 hypothetical protein B4O97_04015 [Marispirochaeta aestuarii]